MRGGLPSLQVAGLGGLLLLLCGAVAPAAAGGRPAGGVEPGRGAALIEGLVAAQGPAAPGVDSAAQPDRGWLAQNQEPTPRADGEPTPPDQRREAQDARALSEEPGKGPDEPRAPEPEAELKRRADEPSYGVGIHLRALFVHEWFLGLFLDEATPLNSMGFGAEFVRRKGDLDLVASIDFGFYSPKDGNYLGKNKNPVTETDYVQFRDLNILSFTAHFIWHQDLTEWLSFVYGVGVGMGIVFGDIYRISNDPNLCTPENAGDINQCLPRNVRPETREEDINRTATGQPDSPTDPHLFKEDGVPPVVPMVHFLVGFNFKINEQLGVRVDGGFRNAFYIGASGQWFFL